MEVPPTEFQPALAVLMARAGCPFRCSTGRIRCRDRRRSRGRAPVASCRRPGCRGVLPRRARPQARDAAAARARVAGLHRRVPHGLTQGIDVVDGEPADARHVGLGGRVVDGRVVVGDAVAVRGAGVTGGRHDGLTLGRHLLEDRLLGRRVTVGVASHVPHDVETTVAVSSSAICWYVSIGSVAVVRSLIDLDRGARGHRRDLFDVERRFVVVATGRTAVDRDRRDRGD
jgi:hypothetical protein